MRKECLLLPALLSLHSGDLDIDSKQGLFEKDLPNQPFELFANWLSEVVPLTSSTHDVTPGERCPSIGTQRNVPKHLPQ